MDSISFLLIGKKNIKKMEKRFSDFLTIFDNFWVFFYGFSDFFWDCLELFLDFWTFFFKLFFKIFFGFFGLFQFLIF